MTVAACVFLLAAIYVNALAHAVDSGQGGHGDFLWILDAIFGLGAVCACLVAVLVEWPHDSKVKTGLKILLIPIFVVALIISTPNIVFNSFRFLFCADALQNVIRSPMLGCNCDPNNCGG